MEHPTLVHDLAAANGYAPLLFWLVDSARAPAVTRSIAERENYVRLALSGDLGAFSHMLVLLKKDEAESRFRAPRQGYYDDRLPAELAQAWQRLPR